MNSNNRYHSSVDSVRGATLYVLLAGFFGIWLAWDAAFVRLVTYAPWADYWEHTAVLNEWLANFRQPGNPHVADPSLSSRYMPAFMALTYIGLLLHLGPVELMSISAVFNYLLIVVGLHVFLKSYFRDPWAPAIGFVAIFLCWGVSWNWSNLYHIRSFFYVASFPSSLVFGLSLLSFALVLKILRRDGSVVILGALLCLMSALMFLCHPLTGVFGIVGCGLLALTESSESLGNRLLIIFFLAAGTALAEFWPFFSVWRLALGMYGSGVEQWAVSDTVSPIERLQSGAWQHIFYNPRLVLTILGPALLGVPLLLWLYVRRECPFIVWGAVVMAIPYALHPLIEVPLAHRFLLFSVTYLQFAIVWGVLQAIDAWNSRPRPANAGRVLAGVVAFAAALLVANIVMLAMEFSGYTLNAKYLEVVNKREGLPADMNVVELYSQLTESLPDDAIVIATPEIGWPLPTTRGKVVSVYHENPLLPDQQERYVATLRFFGQPLSDRERANTIVKYGATHLLIKGDPLTPDLSAWLDAHAMRMAVVGDYRMYWLLASATEAATRDESPVTIEAAGAGPAPGAEAAAEAATPPAAESSVPAVRQDAAPPAAQREAVGEADSAAFGAPITNPLIPPKDDIELPDYDPATAPERSKTPPPEPADKEAKPDNFGAPIAEPVLNPEKNGG